MVPRAAGVAGAKIEMPGTAGTAGVVGIVEPLKEQR